jgi:ribonuclease HI
MYGNCDKSSNDTMELWAVVTALRCLPDGMPVWISTD